MLSLVLSLKAYNSSLNEKRNPEVIRGFVLSKKFENLTALFPFIPSDFRTFQVQSAS